MANLDTQEKTKYCYKCDKHKPIAKFTPYGKNTKGMDAYRKFCVDCRNKKARDYRKEAKLTEKNKAKRRLNKENLVKLFGSKCAKCSGEFAAVCYDFHHLDETKKKYTISNLMSSTMSQEGQKLLMKEAAKCIMVCSNCHRVIHMEEQLIKAEVILNGK